MAELARPPRRDRSKPKRLSAFGRLPTPIGCLPIRVRILTSTDRFADLRLLAKPSRAALGTVFTVSDRIRSNKRLRAALPIRCKRFLPAPGAFAPVPRRASGRPPDPAWRGPRAAQSGRPRRPQLSPSSVCETSGAGSAGAAATSPRSKAGAQNLRRRGMPGCRRSAAMDRDPGHGPDQALSVAP